MFGLSKKTRDQQLPTSTPTIHVRDTLFGDMPLEQWMGGDDEAPPLPWSHFRQARDHWRQGDLEPTQIALRQVLGMPRLESRHYLQAWHFLRKMRQKPSPEEARKVLGAVVEVDLGGGLDIVAAYANGSARYFNFSGATVIWERPNTSLDKQIGALLASTSKLAKEKDPWEGNRDPAPGNDLVRLTALTPAGQILTEGYMDGLLEDPLSAPILDAARSLMEGLIAVANT